MRNAHAQSGRGCLPGVVVLVVLAIAAVAAWTFVHQQPSGPTVSSSPADASSAQQKALAFATAEARAQQSGRPVSVVETFNDAELSSLANEAAQARGMPVDQISLHSTAQGTIQGQAQAHVAGQDLPVSLTGVPVVTDNRVALDVTSTKVGAVPLPPSISDQVTQSIRQPLELGQPIQGFSDLHVSTADGSLTVSGVAQPS